MSSSAVASARKRRAGISQSNPIENMQSSNNSSSTQQSQGLTLPQVISLIDTRLIKLEKFMNETKENRENPNNQMMQQLYTQHQSQPIPNTDQSTISNLSEIIDDFQQRFVLLAEEINSLKDTIIKLQTYTMDVNKTLLEERINILSDLGDNTNMFVLQESEDNHPNEQNTSSEIYNEETNTTNFEFDPIA
jgi:hypothetical protein